jgi:hypothetical protein
MLLPGGGASPPGWRPSSRSSRSWSWLRGDGYPCELPVDLGRHRRTASGTSCRHRSATRTAGAPTTIPKTGAGRGKSTSAGSCGATVAGRSSRIPGGSATAGDGAAPRSNFILPTAGSRAPRAMCGTPGSRIDSVSCRTVIPSWTCACSAGPPSGARSSRRKPRSNAGSAACGAPSLAPSPPSTRAAGVAPRARRAALLLGAESEVRPPERIGPLARLPPGVHRSGGPHPVPSR